MIPIDPDFTSEHALLALKKFPLQVTCMVIAAFVLGLIVGGWV